MNLKTAEMVIGWATPVAAYAVGLGVTFVAAYLPARRAATVSPMAALADAEIAGVGRPLKVRAVVGGRSSARRVPPRSWAARRRRRPASAASLLGLGVVLTLIATVIAGPLLVRPVIRVLGGRLPRAVRLRRPDEPAQRPAQPAPHRRHRRRADGGPRAGRRDVRGERLDDQVLRRRRSTRRWAPTSSSRTPTSCRSRRRSPTRSAPRTASVSSYGSGSRRSPYGCPDGERVETTAAGYDAQLDEVAHVTYARGRHAPPRWRTAPSPWTPTSREDHDVTRRQHDPRRVPGRAERRAEGGRAHRPGHRRRASGCRAGCTSASAPSRSTCPAGRTPRCT